MKYTEWVKAWCAAPVKVAQGRVYQVTKHGVGKYVPATSNKGKES